MPSLHAPGVTASVASPPFSFALNDTPPRPAKRVTGTVCPFSSSGVVYVNPAGPTTPPQNGSVPVKWIVSSAAIPDHGR